MPGILEEYRVSKSCHKRERGVIRVRNGFFVCHIDKSDNVDKVEQNIISIQDRQERLTAGTK
jgi:CRISPR/Cas system-associated endoribonuclease Cas2